MSRRTASRPHVPGAPAGLLRNDTAYRSMGHSRGIGRIGCGFIVKPGRIVDAQDLKVADYSAVWCLRGGGTYRDETGAVFPMRVGSLFHRFPGRSHTTLFEPGCDWAECFIQLTNSLASSLVELGVLDVRRPVQQPGLDLAVVDDLSRMVPLLRDADERELPRHLATLIEILIDLASREQARDTDDDPWRGPIAGACRRLVEDPRLPLEAVAAELRMSYERFRKVFRERMGVSPGEYRIRRRVDRARALLQSTDQPIKAVADQLGYANPYAFSAQFKQLVGESPEAFRRRH